MSVLRVIFYVVFKSSASPYSGTDLAKAFYIGFKYDIRLAAALSLLFVILAWIPWVKRKGTSLIPYLYTFVVISIIIAYFFDFGHYGYLNKRLDASSLRFLEDFWISATMIWQSYPIFWAFVLTAMLSVFGFKLINKYIINFWRASAQSTKKVFTINIILCLLVSAVLIYGKIARYPLRWSEAFFSTNNFISNLACNPILYFQNTFKNRELVFDVDKAKKAYPYVKKYLGLKNNQQFPNYKRTVQFPPNQPEQKMNVVVLVIESLAAFKMGYYNNPLNPTPHLDTLIENSHSFVNHYTPVQGTARGVFATMTGLPDFARVKTSSRNPLVVHQNVIMNQFTQHEKYYFLGGSANWGNIRGIFSNNIEGINIYEEGTYQAPNVDVWGISDLDLFREADAVLKNQKKPFFAVIQTSGFHRPYTIPDDHGNFKEIDIPDTKARQYGYVSTKEFNSMRFSDYSVAEFFKLAKLNKYYDNTLFIIFGDHGLSNLQAKHLSAVEHKLDLGRFHTPLIFHNPKLFPKPIINSKIYASQIDIMPSIATVMKTNYTNTGLGRTLFANRSEDNNNFALTYTFYSQPPILGLIAKDNVYLTDLHLSNSLFNYPGQDLTNYSSEKTEYTKKLRLQSHDLFHTANYMLYHNKNNN